MWVVWNKKGAPCYKSRLKVGVIPRSHRALETLLGMLVFVPRTEKTHQMVLSKVESRRCMIQKGHSGYVVGK